MEELTTNGEFFLQEVLQKVFQKFANPTDPEERAILFKNLSLLLGEELVKSALRLLDEYIIIYYRIHNSKNNACSIVEWCSKRNNTLVYRIVPGTNYCKCRFFYRCVLQLQLELDQDEALTNSDTFANRVAFTCEHILAQQIHQVLQVPQEQFVTSAQFKYLLGSIYDD